jgi:hypothetical protein
MIKEKEYGDLTLKQLTLNQKSNGAQTIHHVTLKCNSTDPYIITLAKIDLPPGLALIQNLNKSSQINSVKASP